MQVQAQMEIYKNYFRKEMRNFIFDSYVRIQVSLAIRWGYVPHKSKTAINN